MDKHEQDVTSYAPLHEYDLSQQPLGLPLAFRRTYLLVGTSPGAVRTADYLPLESAHQPSLKDLLHTLAHYQLTDIGTIDLAQAAATGHETRRPR